MTLHRQHYCDNLNVCTNRFEQLRKSSYRLKEIITFESFNAPLQYLTQSTGYQSRPACTCEPLQSPSFKRPDVFPRARGVKFYFFSIFLKNLFQWTPTLTFNFTLTIISNSSVCNKFFMMEESDSSRKEPSITFLSMINRDNSCKRGKREGLPCQFILQCRARLLEKTSEWRFD